MLGAAAGTGQLALNNSFDWPKTCFLANHLPYVIDSSELTVTALRMRT